MKIGKLRELISLQENLGLKNDIGEVVQLWSTYARVDAEVTPLSGRAFHDAQQINKEITLQIRIRFNKKIQSKHRIKHNDSIYEIVSIQNTNFRDHEQVLLCKVLT